MMRKITYTTAIAALLLPAFLSEKTYAENLSSKWTVNQYTKSRLFVGGYDKEKKILHLGWQVSLKDGWKTYWRTPGDAGLPPQWTWKETSNVSSIAVSWPKPDLLNIFNMDTFIYHHEVILPVDVVVTNAEETVSIGLDMQFLICSDICIPQEGNYNLNVSSLDNIKIPRFQKAQLDRYHDMVPVKLSDTEITIRPDPEHKNMLLIGLPKKFTTVENIIIEGPDGILLGRASTKGKRQFSISYNAKQSLKGLELILTLLQKDGGANEAKIIVSP